jgi:hypothetical protein
MILGKLFSSNYPDATSVATFIFVALWLGISGANLCGRCEGWVLPERGAPNRFADIRCAGHCRDISKVENYLAFNPSGCVSFMFGPGRGSLVVSLS